jgi:hypothetical protein
LAVAAAALAAVAVAPVRARTPCKWRERQRRNQNGNRKLAERRSGQGRWRTDRAAQQAPLRATADLPSVRFAVCLRAMPGSLSAARHAHSDKRTQQTCSRRQQLAVSHAKRVP